ncbi:mitochondrial 50S ribosomal protein L22 [Wolfiporia cocos MD-104 SS10]|uniref:Mitochondrial 50S ribosomal protein L22 n=1 Tax=Wolfiporia cocos (strain MD-104) TaxID=742152 RepID=A0A2H3JTJ8_WOLCO|nr:mitochondrial 50S ribosomal protein L22 [Wolfiporia cocos MD-104 SS10]
MLGTGLRHAGCTLAVLGSTAPHQVASSSRVVLLNARGYASKGPFSWLRDNLAISTRKRNTEEELAAARKEQAEKGQLSVFETLPVEMEQDDPVEGTAPSPKKKYVEHKYSTANFKISHRKLNMLGRQLSGKPIDSAILQMQFSEKRASKRIKSMLAVAKKHAVNYKGLEEKKLVVAEAWVTKGPKVIKRIDIKGRSRFGVREHPDSRLNVVLREGKTRAQLLTEERQRKLKRIVSASITREDVPLRNPGSMWAW